MPMWTDSAQTQLLFPDFEESLLVKATAAPEQPRDALANAAPASTLQTSTTPALRRGPHGWPVPSSVSLDPGEARASIRLPEFDAFLLEKARVISSRFPFAEAEYRNLRRKEPDATEPEIPHFEKVFRLAATIASVPDVEAEADYDTLLVLTAWHSVRPGVEGF